MKGLLSKASEDKGSMPKKSTIFRNVVWFIFFLIVFNYLTGCMFIFY